MAQRSYNAESIERLLAEAAEMEQAGVFKPTPVNIDSLMPAHAFAQNPAANRRSWFASHRVLVAVQMAACVALAASGIWLWQLAGPSSSPQVASNGLHHVEVPLINMTSLTRCITGPADMALSNECQTVDFDADGDVDLADFGQYQLATGGR